MSIFNPNGHYILGDSGAHHSPAWNIIPVWTLMWRSSAYYILDHSVYSLVGRCRCPWLVFFFRYFAKINKYIWSWVWVLEFDLGLELVLFCLNLKLISVVGDGGSVFVAFSNSSAMLLFCLWFGFNFGLVWLGLVYLWFGVFLRFLLFVFYFALLCFSVFCCFLAFPLFCLSRWRFRPSWPWCGGIWLFYRAQQSKSIQSTSTL